MQLRNQILQIVATPDRTWLTILGGILLLCREFIAPGRIIPGVLGGCGVILGAVALTEYRLNPQGLSALLLSIALLLLIWRWRPWYFPTLLAASVGASGARLLVLPPWKISAGVALATMPALVLVGYLLSIAVRARMNKLSLRYPTTRSSSSR